MKQDLISNQVLKDRQASFGANGFNELEPVDANTQAGIVYYAIKAIGEDTRVTATCHPLKAAGDTSIDVTIPSGDVIYGRFSNINLPDTGKAWAYLE